MGAVRLAVFDCDGTLVDGQHDICAAMEEAFANLGLTAPPRGVVRLSTRSPLQGAQVENLSPAVMDELSLDAATLGVEAGVIVVDVAEGTPAAVFGVQKGDVVLGVNGAEIHETRDLVAATAQKARAWDLVIARGGQTIRTRVNY